MITDEDGTLTYTSAIHPFRSWRPDNDIVFILSVAVVTTLISYHATGIILNLCLGIKPRHSATVSDLQISRLVVSTSPLALFRNIFPNSYREAHLRKRKTSPDRDPDSETTHPGQVPSKVLFKLFFLLAIAPLMNVIAIFLAMEYETKVTFAESGLGGLAFGTNNDLSTVKSMELDLGDYSVELPVASYNYDTVLAKFLIIGDGGVQEVLEGGASPGPAQFLVISGNLGSYELHFISSAGFVGFIGSGYMQVLEGPQHGKNFAIQPLIEASNLHRLCDFGMDLLIEFCGLGIAQNGVNKATYNPRENGIIVEREFNCTATPTEIHEVKSIFTRIFKKLTFVDSEFLQLADVRAGEDTFFRADDFFFLKRRRNYTSLPILFAVFVVLAIVRIFVTILTRNDLSKGVGFVIRNVIGLNWCDTMLVHDNCDDIAKS